MAGTDFRPPADREPPPQPAPAAVPQPVAVAAAAAVDGVDDAEDIPVASQPMFDWLTEVLIPLAVFGLLASFFYYLLDVRGSVGSEGIRGLRWVCFWFLLGTILTTRMRTRYGSHVIALPYMLGLGIAMCLFIFHITVYSGAFIGMANTAGQIVALVFNYALVGVIWWIAGVVTRACTAEENFALMDEQGLLTSISRRKKATRRGRSTPRHPGWVLMWTSLVALVAFAAGQSIVGASGQAHQRHAFMCMVSYSFFALVLLALTSLSALRMNARQRRIRIHKSITPVWTIASAAIVALILALASLLPTVKAADAIRRQIAQLPSWVREPPSTPLSNSPEVGIRDPEADPGGDQESGLDEGARGGAAGDQSGEHPDQGDDPSESPGGGEGGDDSAQEQGAGSGEDGSNETGAAGASGQGSEGDEHQSGEQGAGDTGDSEQGQGGGSDEDQHTPEPGGGSSDAGGEAQSDGASGGGDHGDNSSDSSAEGQSDAAGGASILPPWWLWLLILLALLLLALLIAYLIWRAWKNRKNWPSFKLWLASLVGMAKDAIVEAWQRIIDGIGRAWAWVLGLFGRRVRSRKLGEDGLPEDPFLDIFNDRELAATLTPAQVLRHVYAAFQAFGGLIGHPRDDDQTPYEFERGLPGYIGGMPRHDAEQLTGLYVKAAYSPESVDDDDVGEARRIWERMQEPIDTALAEKKRPAKTSAPAPA